VGVRLCSVPPLLEWVVEVVVDGVKPKMDPIAPVMFCFHGIRLVPFLFGLPDD
jgi:hypothetical protein